jgi:hypothetical protein
MIDKVIQIANLRHNDRFHNPQAGRAYWDKGISPTLLTFQGGDREPKFLHIVPLVSETPILKYVIGRTNHGECGSTSNYHVNPYFGCVTKMRRDNREPLILEVYE